MVGDQAHVKEHRVAPGVCGVSESDERPVNEDAATAYPAQKAAATQTAPTSTMLKITTCRPEGRSQSLTLPDPGGKPATASSRR
jgi:hypothetical protein